MTAQNVPDRTSAAASSAAIATNDITGQTLPIWPDTSSLWPDTRRIIPSNGGNGSITILAAEDGTIPTSKPFAAPSKRWSKPRDAKAFASQANEVATMILNGEISAETARLYIGAARAMAQVLSTEVYRARFLNQEPNLSLE